MPPPRLEEQLLNLTPRGRLIAGAILLPTGLLSSVALWGRGLIWYGSAFAILFGGALAASGWRDHRRQAAIDVEVARARREWADLQRVVAQAKQDGENVARLLQQRGYREFAVRRWLARECGDVPAEGHMP